MRNNQAMAENWRFVIGEYGIYMFFFFCILTGVNFHFWNPTKERFDAEWYPKPVSLSLSIIYNLMTHWKVYSEDNLDNPNV